MSMPNVFRIKTTGLDFISLLRPVNKGVIRSTV